MLVFRRAWIGSLIVCCVLLGNAVGATEQPQRLTLSYVNHPVIKSELIPLVERAYAQLGIEIVFVEQPSARNLRQASRGVIDGDVAFSDLLVASYQSLKSVGPTFLETVFVLLCTEGVPCNMDVLSNPTQTLVMTDASLSGLVAKYGVGIQAKPYSINNLDRIPQLLSDGKFTHGIYVTSPSKVSLKDYQNLQVVELFRTQTHHVLHKKHRAIFPQIDQALRRELGLGEEIMGPRQ